MKNLKKYYYIIIGLFLLSTFLNPLEGIVVNAANDGLSDALNNAPDGISLDNGRFAMPKEDPSGQTYNPGVSSKVIPTTGTNPSSRVLQVLNDQYQTGGIWGDPSRNNYVSTNKKQVISMWLNMSKLNGGTDLGDGLAFVLQNDSRKTNAIATAGSKSKINNGESLGVWGNDNYGSEDPSTGAKSVASDAIQNSWALEFDSYPDNIERDTMPDDGSTSISGFNASGNTITQNTNAGKVYNSLINGTSDAIRLI